MENERRIIYKRKILSLSLIILSHYWKGLVHSELYLLRWEGPHSWLLTVFLIPLGRTPPLVSRTLDATSNSPTKNPPLIRYNYIEDYDRGWRQWIWRIPSVRNMIIKEDGTYQWQDDPLPLLIIKSNPQRRCGSNVLLGINTFRFRCCSVQSLPIVLSSHSALGQKGDLPSLVPRSDNGANSDGSISLWRLGPAQPAVHQWGSWSDPESSSWWVLTGNNVRPDEPWVPRRLYLCGSWRIPGGSDNARNMWEFLESHAVS